MKYCQTVPNKPGLKLAEIQDIIPRKEIEGFILEHYLTHCKNRILPTLKMGKITL